MDKDDLAAMIGEGLSLREIAGRTGKGYSTVRYWMRRHGLKTVTTARRSARRGAEELRDCRRHGEQVYRRDGSGTYRCVRCTSEAVSRRRRKVKETIVAEAGGAYLLCGYDRCVAALEFHHVDPATKRFGLAAQGLARSIETIREEARKCVLLCSNCHAEVENGVTALPSTLRVSA